MSVFRNAQWKWSGVRIPTWARYFVLLETSIKCLGPTKTPNQWLPGLFPWGKAAGARCWLLSSSAKVKNEWIYTPPPPICLNDVDRGGFVLLMFIPNCISFAISGRGENFWLLLNVRSGFEVDTVCCALDDADCSHRLKRMEHKAGHWAAANV